MASQIASLINPLYQPPTPTMKVGPDRLTDCPPHQPPLRWRWALIASLIAPLISHSYDRGGSATLDMPPPPTFL